MVKLEKTASSVGSGFPAAENDTADSENIVTESIGGICGMSRAKPGMLHRWMTTWSNEELVTLCWLCIAPFPLI